MQIQQNYNYAPNFQSRNETKIFGEFLNHPKIQGEMIDRFAKNNLYKEFCGKYKTRATLDASKPGSTCIASFDVDYKPVKKGLKRIFSFVTPYKNLHFSGYGESYKQAFDHLKMTMFDETAGLLNDRLLEILRK